ncbi:hypothetical protein GQ54DRAFT_109963 [Martensiomyces pterosporus]|nr:hypothetical protein GQ54DRAFT_109963 [Martensiomyces pterosporus]
MVPGTRWVALDNSRLCSLSHYCLSLASAVHTPRQPRPCQTCSTFPALWSEQKDASMLHLAWFCKIFLALALARQGCKRQLEDGLLKKSSERRGGENREAHSKEDSEGWLLPMNAQHNEHNEQNVAEEEHGDGAATRRWQQQRLPGCGPCGGTSRQHRPGCPEASTRSCR